MTLADVNADGRLDIIVSETFFANDNIQIFLQQAGGGFPFSDDITLADAGINDPDKILAVDLDGDELVDVVSANNSSNNITAFFQTSAGVFNTTPVTITDASLDSPTSVAAADMDGDGRLDLVVANGGALNTLQVFRQTAARVFQPTTTIDPNDLTVMNLPQAVVAVDIDRDGDIDLASGDDINGSLTIFLQVSPGVFDSNLGTADTDPAFQVTPANNKVRDLEMADVDGDGDLDLITSNNAGDSLLVFRQTAPGQFETEPVSVLTTDTLAGPVGIAVADIDGDGTVEIGSANTTSGNITIFSTNQR